MNTENKPLTQDDLKKASITFAMTKKEKSDLIRNLKSQGRELSAGVRWLVQDFNAKMEKESS